MLFTRRQRNNVFYIVSDCEPSGLTPIRRRGSDLLPISARTCSREGAGPTWRRAPGERRFGCGESLFLSGALGLRGWV